MTPSTAIVRATIQGRPVLIDFINGALGVRRTDQLRRDAMELALPMRRQDGSVAGTLLIPVMHPVHCLISRIANVLSPATRRKDDVALRQLYAAPLVVEAYIEDMLDSGDTREAIHCVQSIHRYLKTGQFGRDAHKSVGFDPLDIIRAFAEHPGFDPRYRKHTISNMIREIEQRRAQRERNEAGRSSD